MKDISSYTGCLLGGAVGDALGGPVEFHSIHEIRRRWGSDGITGYVELNRRGQAEFTDDTQMTLFTAEGLLSATAAAGSINPAMYLEPVYGSYRRWLRTQTETFNPGQERGLLLSQGALWRRKAPGVTCLSALSSGIMGMVNNPINNSKGCGAVMRAAPVGLLLDASQYGCAAFDLGCAAGATTHGHPSGYLPSGFLAQLIAELVAGRSLEVSLKSCMELLKGHRGHEETTRAVQKALETANASSLPPCPETVETLGAGWVGEEALAIALYSTWIGAQEKSFARGVLLAVNHSGDCDSTGAIAGNLLGLVLGRESIPEEWLAPLELREVIEQVAAGLLDAGRDASVLRDNFPNI